MCGYVLFFLAMNPMQTYNYFQFKKKRFHSIQKNPTIEVILWIKECQQQIQIFLLYFSVVPEFRMIQLSIFCIPD